MKASKELIISLVVVVLLLAGIGVGVYLTQRPQNLNPQATDEVSGQIKEPRLPDPNNPTDGAVQFISSDSATQLPSNPPL